MRKIYLVKKDPELPADGNNWIVMSGHEFAMFMQTPEGKQRKNNFGQLDACTMDDVIIIAECGVDTAKRWRSEKDKQDHSKKLKDDSGIEIYSYEALDKIDQELTGEEWLVDTGCNVEAEVQQKMQIEELYKAVELLDEADRLLISSLYLSKKVMTAVEFGKAHGFSPQLIQYYKRRALSRLKKYSKTEIYFLFCSEIFPIKY